VSKPCYVYMLLNPFTGDPFYIGISDNPWCRFYEHCHDRCSAAWDFLGYLIENCGFEREQILEIYEECPNRRSAFDLEYQLVTTTAGLLNRPYKRGRAYT
jgi:predicted GIY-YIG superfamily endonuclease